MNYYIHYITLSDFTTMSDGQYNQYINLHTFAKDWRKYKQVTPQRDKDTFRKNMQADQYVKLEYVNDKTGKPVLIYLLSKGDKKGSKYSNSSQDLKRLLAKIKDPSDVILVSRNELKIYSQKAIASFHHLRIKTYLHENFDLVIPNGPLCYPHRILSHAEVNKLLNDDLCCALINLPKILAEDVQCIWIGAEVGDVVEITMLSDITSESIQYRVVVPKSGRVISFRSELDESKEKIEDEDDEVAEHREDIANEKEDEEEDEIVDVDAE
jgi:DNA-directed RNA polymerase subunit H (RpoH/RPB5)